MKDWLEVHGSQLERNTETGEHFHAHSSLEALRYKRMMSAMGAKLI